METKDKSKDWKIRIIKSDLPELKERVNFLTGNAWDISIGIDGVEGVDDVDGRLVVCDVPDDWPVQVMLEWLRVRKRSRNKVVDQMKDEIRSLTFVEDLAKRQLAEIGKEVEE